MEGVTTMNRLDELIERLEKVEALVERGATQGERDAAENARDSILERLKLHRREEQILEHKFCFNNHFSRKLFMAICARYDIDTYRYKRQHYTTLQIRAPERFVDNTLWPLYEEYRSVLYEHLNAVTDHVIGRVFDNAPADDDAMKLEE
jgi:hypothetical protein